MSRNRLLTSVAWQRRGRRDQLRARGQRLRRRRAGAVAARRPGHHRARRPRSRRWPPRVPDSGGVIIVPALAGLGAPHWRPEARGLITGITRGTTRAHLARAALEAIALQIVELVRAMEADAGRPLTRAAGRRRRRGQQPADADPGRPARAWRWCGPACVESTALGAAPPGRAGDRVLHRSGAAPRRRAVGRRRPSSSPSPGRTPQRGPQRLRAAGKKRSQRRKLAAAHGSMSSAPPPP